MDVMPELVGGLESLQKNLDYTPEAVEAGVEGRVIVRVIVDLDGTPRYAECLRGPEVLCDAAVRAVEASTFTPGQQRGQTVRARYSVPVTFRLQ